MLFQYLLESMVRQGTLRLVAANGKEFIFGDGQTPSATIKLHRRSLEWTLALYPQLRLGEAYMDGLLTIERGSLRDFMQLIAVNIHNLKHQKFFVFIDVVLQKINSLLALNPIRIARKNISYHYDIDPRIYEFFLDSDRQYSCGYFESPNVGLEKAQHDKKRHIASKLYLIKPGLKVLDVGSGWGGLGLYLARENACQVTGVTLSREQLAISEHRAAASGLQRHCRFTLRDYRHETGPYDRIVSVGMFEHVGRKNYDAFFIKMREILADDGVGLLHSIGRFDNSSSVNPFIRKYIFPGGEIPRLSDVMASVERSGLFVTDIEILRLHYAETLKNWHERFQARRADAAQIYDERFCRKWEFYLAGSEASFRSGHFMVFQLQFAKRVDTLPMTRDYMTYEQEIAADMPSLEAAM